MVIGLDHVLGRVGIVIVDSPGEQRLVSQVRQLVAGVRGLVGGELPAEKRPRQGAAGLDELAVGHEPQAKLVQFGGGEIASDRRRLDGLLVAVGVVALAVVAGLAVAVGSVGDDVAVSLGGLFVVAGLGLVVGPQQDHDRQGEHGRPADDEQQALLG